MSVPSAVLVRDESLLAGLSAEWAELWTRGGQWPFQHPAWLLPWWSVFGTGAPRVAVLRDAEHRLIGLLPMYELHAERKILPMGAGLSDYQDALLAPEAPQDAAGVLLRTALQGCDWECHLPDVPPGAALRGAALPGWRVAQHPGEPCPVLLAGGVPARQRRKLRMARHRAGRAGGYTVIADGEADLFAELVRLHTELWAGRGQPGVLADPAVRAFHAAALPQLRRAGLVQLRGLRLGGGVAAAIYVLHSPGRTLFYLSGFDAARAFESPGTILLGEMIEAAGDAELHFLRGAEPYKYAWGAIDRHNATLVLERE